MPAILPDRARAMRATGAEVIKIAGTRQRLTDCLPLLDGRKRSSDGDGGPDCDGRGRPDHESLPRIRIGLDLRRDATTDVGQTAARSLLDEYRFPLDARPSAYGLAGSPIAHSVSPAMHNAAFVATGRDAVYLPFPAADADDFVAFAARLGREGRERDDSIQSRAARSRGRRRSTRLDEIGAAEHDPHERRTVARSQHRRGGFLRAARRSGSRWPGARLDSRRRRIGRAVAVAFASREAR